MGEGMQKKRNFFGCNFSLRKNRRGLSAIVTTLLIILLSIVAIGAVWVVISNVIDEGSEDINLAQFTLDIAIKSAYVDTADLNNVKVRVRRDVGSGEITGIKFIFFDGVDSITITEETSLDELDEEVFSFTPAELGGIGGGATVSIAPIFDSSGSEKTGEITDTEKISSTVSGSGTGGGPPSGGTPGEGYCGDDLVQYPNGEVPLINEQCDGLNLGGKTCTDVQDFTGGGPLSCTGGCMFDTSLCTGGTPVTCGNGVIDIGEQCDGGNKCDGTCSCPTGFTADGAGGCNLNAPINAGTINSVWNKIYIDSEDFPKSQVAMAGYLTSPPHSMNFSGSPEIGCFSINFGDFLFEINISYVRLDDSLGFPNVAANESYSVWEAANCGA